jgi:Protein of unknown function (DUF3830)
MVRRVRVEVDGVTAIAELCEDVSPLTTEAFWKSLPIDATLAPAKWSGQACYFLPGGDSLKRVPRNENAVCSIYPGYIVTRPGGSEALIAYGPAEYRWAVGTDYTTRVGRLREGAADLLNMIARTHTEGDKRIRITAG